MPQPYSYSTENSEEPKYCTAPFPCPRRAQTVIFRPVGAAPTHWLHRAGRHSNDIAFARMNPLPFVVPARSKPTLSRLLQRGHVDHAVIGPRSEERRVGEECERR